jgi:hypothetical protein
MSSSIANTSDYYKNVELASKNMVLLKEKTTSNVFSCYLNAILDKMPLDKHFTFIASINGIGDEFIDDY